MAEGFNFDIKDVLEKTIYAQQKVISGCQHYAKSAGNQMLADAKHNARWTDRTGLSRQTMDMIVVNENGIITIQLRGNTPQFQYLEYAMEKRFAILNPTVEKWAPQVLRGWAETVSGLA